MSKYSEENLSRIGNATDVLYMKLENDNFLNICRTNCIVDGGS